MFVTRKLLVEVTASRVSFEATASLLRLPWGLGTNSQLAVGAQFHNIRISSILGEQPSIGSTGTCLPCMYAHTLGRRVPGIPTNYIFVWWWRHSADCADDPLPNVHTGTAFCKHKVRWWLNCRPSNSGTPFWTVWILCFWTAMVGGVRPAVLNSNKLYCVCVCVVWPYDMS